tara:strand:+ start:7641 stop:9386 length:1746 start_codon:yes stop_codon:yes gene_type:complete
MTKHKRGALLYAPVLLVFLIFGLIYAWSEITARYKEFDREIGGRQFDLINTYHLGEAYLSYIDQSAKYSVPQAIYDLGKAGGCYLGNTHRGYRLWTVDSPSPGLCFPSTDDSKNGFFNFFSNKLSFYLSEYRPTKLLFDDPTTPYAFSFESGDVIGEAQLHLNIPIIKGKGESESPGKYTINPSFRVKIENYDFSNYDALKSGAGEVINRCELVNPKRIPSRCVNEHQSKQFFNNLPNLALSVCPDGSEAVKLLGYTWESGVRTSTYGFCVKSDNPKVYAYDGDDDTLGLKDITYRFALEFEDVSCTGGNPELVNTQCNEISCEHFYDCRDATSLCYCDEGGLENACQGSCLPFCSVTGFVRGDVEDGDASTKCTEFPCVSYMSCTGVAANTCGCPSRDEPGDEYACQGSDCETFHCNRDPIVAGEKDTQCMDDCNKYGDCDGTSSCSCDSPLVACEGRCYCNPQGWEDTGDCGEARDDGVTCDWNEVPRKHEYNPSSCSSTDYDCDPRPIEECPCIPETSCADLGCGNTDSCDNFCGPCPVPLPPPCAGDGESCEIMGCCGSLVCNQDDPDPINFFCESP